MVNITDNSNCCGCEACVQICPKSCINIKEDLEGFIYPVVDTNICINCGLCDKVCPCLDTKTELSNLPIAIWAAKHKNHSVINNSSSGGVFSLLADYVLARSGIVFGACFDSDWGVFHDFTEQEANLDRFRRSKYVQSRIGNSFKDVEKFLKNDRYVLFCGTPCQIKGLNKFLRKPYEKLVTVDFICHGVPSPLVWSKYLDEVTFDRKTIKKINFRDKSNGWENFKLVIETTTSDSETYNFSQSHKRNLFMKGFLHNIYLRPSCYNCCAKSGTSHSDIQLADLWGAKEIDKDFYNKTGVSLVIAASEKGSQLFNEINLDKITLKYEDLVLGNISYSHSSSKPVQRDIFFDNFNKESIISLIERLTKPTIKDTIRLNTRLLLVKLGISHKLNILIDRWKKNA